MEDLTEAALCGRPTRAGKPCRNRLDRFEMACRTHATSHQQEVAAAAREGWSTGFREGFRSGVQSGESRIAHLEARLHEVEQAAIRSVDEFTGDQVVEVGRYAYRWAGSPPLKLGDRVLLPKSWLSDLRGDTGLQEGEVTALQSAYQGELKAIVRRVADAESNDVVLDPR